MNWQHPSCLDLHIGWDHCFALPHTLYILLLILVSEFKYKIFLIGFSTHVVGENTALFLEEI